MFRRIAVLIASTLMLVIGLTAQGAPVALAAGRAVVVLDPDDNVGFASWPGIGTVTELPNNVRLANEVKTRLEEQCRAEVVITRDGAQDTVSRDARKATALAADPDVMVTLAFNALTGAPWGVEADGGVKVKARAQDVALGNAFLTQVPAYTGRPSTQGVGTDVSYPLYPEYDDLAFPYAHVEALFLDHNYDHAVIEGNFGLIADGVFAAILDQLNASGLGCSAYPSRPSAEELKRLRNLGYQNFQRYGADPISMSTGNFVTSEELFRQTGLGAQEMDFTLHYNAQAGRDSQVGQNWTFAYGSYTQAYDDDSVAVALSDGRTFLFEPDGSGGFTSPAGAFAALAWDGDTTLVWTSTLGERQTFEVNDDTGRGALTSSTDRQGNTISLTYSGDGTLFPRLATVTDQAGQQIPVSTDDAGRVTAVTRPGGDTWHLSYDGDGNLIELTSASAKSRTFGYDDEHRMTSETGPDGVVYLRNTYDAKSRVVKQLNSTGEQRTLVFDETAGTTTYTDTTGAVTTYFWDDAGRVTKVVDANGGQTLTAYNGQSQTSSTTDPLGRVTTTDYDPTGRVAKTILPNGAVQSATYTPTGDAASTTDQGGSGGSARTTTFDTNADGLPTTITNPDGTTVTRTYSDAGDLLTETDELGHTATFDYDARGNLTEVTDRNGHPSTYAYDAANRLTKVTDARGHATTYTYDKDDNVLTVEYPDGGRDEYTYDANDQITQHVDPRGAVTRYEYDTELNLTTMTLPNDGTVTYTFDAENRATSMTDPRGNVTTYTLDPVGNVTKTTDTRGNDWSSQYDLANQLTKTIDPTGAATTHTRDALGQPTTITAADGGTTQIAYDTVGRITTVTDPRGGVTSYTYTSRDAVATTTDALGAVVTNTYDDAGRLTKTVDKRGSATTYDLDAVGNVTRVTDDLGGVTTTTYDAADNPVTLIDANGHTTTTAYDELNRVVKTVDGVGNATTFTLDRGGLRTAVKNGLGHITATEYDAMGLPVKVTDPLGRPTTTSYDAVGNPIAVTAPDGILTANTHDEAGNLTSVTENKAAGAATADRNVTTTYTYDARNLLSTITAADGGGTAFTRDALGRVAKETNQLGNVTSYGYDQAGNQTTRTDAKGVTTTYTYDALQQLTKRTYSSGGADTFAYDPAGAQTKAVNTTGAVTTTYDALGRPSTTTDAGGKKLTMSYDGVGNRTKLVLPDGASVTYGYDAADRNTSLTSPLGAVSIAYDAANRPTTLTRANGTVTTNTYTAADEIASLITTKGSTTLATFAYTYTPDSSVATKTQKVGAAAGRTITYGYDGLSRLTSSAGSALDSTYTYDAVGNRVKWAGADDPYSSKIGDPFTQTNTYNLAGQMTKSVKVHKPGTSTFTDTSVSTWDTNGNLTGTVTQIQETSSPAYEAYVYDAENRLIAGGPASTGGNICGTPGADATGCPTGINKDLNLGNAGLSGKSNTFTRTYDALGRLVTETNGTKGKTTWTHDGLDPIHATGTYAGTYLRDGYGDLLGEKTTAGSVQWYVKDALGSIFTSTTSAGALAKQSTDYSDYGMQLSNTTYNFGNTSERTDMSANGLVNFYARGYLPNTATWAQADPYRGSLTSPETLSRYSYVGGQPSTWKDAYGYARVAFVSRFGFSSWRHLAGMFGEGLAEFFVTSWALQNAAASISISRLTHLRNQIRNQMGWAGHLGGLIEQAVGVIDFVLADVGLNKVRYVSGYTNFKGTSVASKFQWQPLVQSWARSTMSAKTLMTAGSVVGSVGRVFSALGVVSGSISAWNGFSSGDSGAGWGGATDAAIGGAGIGVSFLAGAAAVGGGVIVGGVALGKGLVDWSIPYSSSSQDSLLDYQAKRMYGVSSGQLSPSQATGLSNRYSGWGGWAHMISDKMDQSWDSLF